MSKPHIPYFSFYPSDFMNGVRGLSAQDVGVYTMLLCRIYEENGPVEYHALRLATYCGMRVPTFEKAVDKLVELGKLTITCGMLSNDRAESEIAKRAHDLKNSSKAGKASAEKRKQNQQNEATDVQRTFNHTDTDTDKKEEPNGSLSPASDVSQAFEDYNRVAAEAGWPKAAKFDAARQTALKKRLRDCGGLEGWRSALARARASPHCCGQNDRGWTASFDFLTQAKSFAKLMEGNYDPRPRDNIKHLPQGPKRADPALEQIARLAGLGAASGDGRGGVGSPRQEDGPFRLGTGPQ